MDDPFVESYAKPWKKKELQVLRGRKVDE